MDSVIQIPIAHTGQIEIYKNRARFNRVRCGRRFGKTYLAEILACDAVFAGQSVGWFVPKYKILSEAYNEISDILEPIKLNASKIDGVISVIGGGRIDFWTLENEQAGRSRKYHTVIIDEAAFAKTNMMEIWERAIKPTLLDYVGNAWVFSTPNGSDDENFFYRIGEDKKYGFKDHHAPTHSNPYLPREELLKLEKDTDPLVYRQEYLAEFVDWSGVSFFSIDKLLIDNEPVKYPVTCEYVFAVIDTAMKGGKEHDGTAVVYFSYSDANPNLTILDYDVLQIDGALLISWLPSVFEKLEVFAKSCLARFGNTGVFIEDMGSGTVLLQSSKMRGYPVIPIPHSLTSLGKDERALSVSSHFHQEKVKISNFAYDKVVSFKETNKNHLLHQISTFTIGDKKAYNRSDDLLDCFTYGIALACGNNEGF